LQLKSEGFEVLLVEDSSDDVRLTREALKDAKVRINLHVAKPVGLEGFLTVTKSIDSSWLTVVRLPTREAQERESRPGVEHDPGGARLSLSE
jgi:hypothetical protein